MFFRLLLFKLVFSQTIETFEPKGNELKDWNPFNTSKGKIYTYVPNNPYPGTGRLPNQRANKNATNEGLGKNSTSTQSQTPVEKTTTPSGANTRFPNVPQKYRYKCKEKDNSSTVYVAWEMQSGKYCLFMDVLISCISKPARANLYPVVQHIREPDPQYNSSDLNSGLLMGAESYIFSYYFVCSFVEELRIKCQAKFKDFPALTDITPTSSFSFTDPSDNSRWILVVDNSSYSEGRKHFYRHFIENGKKLLKTLTQEYEIDSSTLIYRRRHHVEGYSFVGQSYYKFIYQTNTDFSEKSEISRLLWGRNQELIGCPKPICHASVVDTVIKLKDNMTYVFVGKYYWNLTNGLSVEKAVFIDAITPYDTQFPYMFSDVDSSFYDIESDEAYFLRGNYVYSYVKTEAFPPIRTVPHIYGQSISQVLPGVPEATNAAFYYRPNSTVYFFRGYHYWAFNLKRKSMLAGYPRLVTDFEGMPANIDSILSDNFGTYYVFYGTFYAKFSENDFQLGMKLKFFVSNVEFFGCDEKYFDDYSQYKTQMETKFGVISAKALLELTNNEGITEDVITESPVLSSNTTTSEPQEQSFLTNLAQLLLFGPFFYQMFTESEKVSKHKSFEYLAENSIKNIK